MILRSPKDIGQHSTAHRHTLFLQTLSLPYHIDPGGMCEEAKQICVFEISGQDGTS